MSEISDKTVLVCDHSLFLGMAQRLARAGFKRVLYFTNWEEGFSTLTDNIVGDGMEDEGIERCEDIWPLIDKKEVDLVCFPDIQNAGLQLHLESLGLRVWGSRAADKLEWNREFLKKTQSDLKMLVPKHRLIVGLDNLRAYLKDNENKYIKFSKYRGMMETRKHINYALSEQWLDLMAYKWSPFKSWLRFIVEDELETDIELGFDGYCIDGEFPNEAVSGIEKKDAGYLGAVMPYSEMPDELLDCQEELVPFLKQNRYRNQFSTEVRIKDGKSYLTDPTMRHASPAGECLLELLDNFGEIVWGGAAGEMVQPKFSAKFAVQTMISHKDDEDGWRAIQIPEEVTRWVKLYRACDNGEAYQIAPISPHFAEIGSVIGIGNTIEEAMTRLKSNIDKIKDNPIEVSADSLYAAIKEAHTAEKEGIDLSDKPLPRADIALTK